MLLLQVLFSLLAFLRSRQSLSVLSLSYFRLMEELVIVTTQSSRLLAYSYRQTLKADPR